MTRLANSSDTIPLQIFAEALEPAQRYTRQHLKYQAGHYTLADTLPAESDKVSELDHQVDALIVNLGDRQALQAICHQLRAWQQNVAQVEPLLAQNPLLPVAGQVAASS